ncbi:MAG: pyridoxal phosphate-dependent aminotransferase family protein [Kiritimatiellae bacterium]|nr:pyridoxal phosphate-dependent aminotransferase family protein [Kiritimatiellia bacterium]
MNVVHFAGNDYLGLARDPRLATAACAAAQRYGIGATSGRFFVGWTELHRKLEEDIRLFFEAEGACLLPSSYLGGLVFFKALAGEFEIAVCDEYAHSNLLEGIRAAGLPFSMYRHMDVNDLEVRLRCCAGQRVVIVTDGVFGISGEIAPVRELVAVTEKVGAHLLIDDAHGVFALGYNGRGVCEMAGVGLTARITLLGSMSKALGCHGGFFVGRQHYIERLQHASAGASPAALPVVAACSEALRIVRSDPERRRRMEANALRMRQIFTAHRIPVVSPTGPIVTAVLPNEERARSLAQHLEARGLVVRYANYPSEPRQNLLRTAARSCHTEEDLARFEAEVAAWVGGREL